MHHLSLRQGVLGSDHLNRETRLDHLRYGREAEILRAINSEKWLSESFLECLVSSLELVDLDMEWRVVR